jgi:hypothetical protein
MIEIVANAQTGAAVYSLDVQEVPVEFNYSIQEMRDISQSRAPHSLRFDMPMTDNNNQFFGQFYNVNFVSAKFNVGVKTNVEVFDSGVVIMVGVLQLHSVNPTGKKYSVSIISEVGALFDAVKDLSFNEVFIDKAGNVDTDLDHALTAENIVDSWDLANDITSGGVGAGIIVYPLSDWGLGGDSPQGYGFMYMGEAMGMGFAGSDVINNIVAPYNFKPSISVPYLISRIAQKAGFTISSSFFGGYEFRHLYMFLATELERTAGRAVYASKVGLDGDFSIAPNNVLEQLQLPFVNESTPFNDVDGLFNGGVFVAPFSGSFTFKHNLYVTSAATPDTGFYMAVVYIYKTSGSDNTMEYFHAHQLTYGTGSTLIGENITITCSLGDTITWYVGATNNNNAVSVKEVSGVNVSFIELQQYTSTGLFVDVSANFPDVKVGEWLSEIFNRFNLVLYSNPQNPSVLNIETYNDLLGSGTEQKDWSEKVDIDTISIEPSLKYQKKIITFEDGEGEDWRNDWWQKQYGFVKGRWIEENENAFTTGEQRIGGMFQPLRLSHIPSSFQNGATVIPNVLVPRLYGLGWNNNSVKEVVSTKPILAYYHGEQNIENNGIFRIGGSIAGYEDVTTYPFFSQYNTTPVTSSSSALNWGYDWPDNIDHPLINAGTTAGITNLYAVRKYWARRLHEEYSSESRIMTCKAYLTPQDINQLLWQDEIFINDTFWRVVKVSNFATGGNTPCSLELVKLINSSTYNKTPLCNSAPTSFNTDGTVNFTELDTGASATPTQDCCTSNGFTWDATNSVCFWAANGGGSPNPNGGGSNPAQDGTKNLGTSNTGGKVIGDVASSEGKSLNANGILGSTQQFLMTATTTDATNTSAEGIGGEKSLPFDPNCIYLITADIISVDTGGSAGTVGETMTLRYQATLGNTAGTSRSVGTTLISSEADAGVSRSVTINQKQNAAGEIAYWEMLCVGEVNKDITWLLDIKMLQLTFPDSTNRNTLAIWNLASEPLITLNLSTDPYLTWN